MVYPCEKTHNNCIEFARCADRQPAARIRSRVIELYKDTHESMHKSYRNSFPKDCRGDFMSVASWLLWALSSLIARCDQIEEKGLEFGFINFKDDELSDAGK